MIDNKCICGNYFCMIDKCNCDCKINDCDCLCNLEEKLKRGDK